MSGSSESGVFLFLEEVDVFSTDLPVSGVSYLVWGIPALFVSICVVFQYQEYGGEVSELVF